MTPTQHPRSRVLIFRSCRQAQFRGAITSARARYPGAEIWALTHEEFSRTAREAGADRVIEHRAVRLGIRQLPRSLTGQLRRDAFDAVVVPQTTPDPISAANLYRLARWIAAAETLVVASGEEPRAYTRAGIAGLACRSTLAGLTEAWITVALLAKALFYRRLRRRAPIVDRARLRVLHVIDHLGMGGAQVQLAELLNHTPLDRYDVEVLALSPTSDVSGHRLTGAIRISSLGERLRPSQRISAAREYCRAGRFDVVHTWLFGSNIAGVTGAALAGVPRIVTAIRSANPGLYPQQLEWWHRIADALSSRIADVITVNASALVADHARWAKIPQERIRVVHNGIDPAPLEEISAGARAWLRDSLALPPDARVIGTVGRLAGEKDHATFLRAVAQVVDAGLDVHAVVAGEGPLREALEALARDVGLDGSRLHWLGARADARRVIAGLDVFVLTSRIEGFPNALLEAAMLGVPIVASDVGGVADILGRTDDLFPPGDHVTAARIITRKLDRGEAGDLAAAIRERCYRLFTTRQLLSRWSRVYGWETAA